MPVKTYVLLPHTNSTAPIYIKVNKEKRVRLEKRPIDAAFLQITFTESDQGIKEGEFPKNRTLRLKMNSNSIFQDEQIKEGILANVPFTTAERDAVVFKQGVLTTRYDIVQKFLDSHPQNKKFKGLCDSIKQPLFEEYDKSVELKTTTNDFRKRLAAANKIAAITDLKEGQDLMIRLNGTFFKTPDTMDEVMSGLIDFLDNAEELGLDKILSDTVTKDEKITILVGRAINAGIISFDAKPNQVSLKKNNVWVDVKMISSDLSGSERQRYFAEFLASKDGELLLNDLKKQVDESLVKKLSKVTS